MAVDLVNAFTVLSLNGIGVAPYSARGLKQAITHIDQAAQLRRSITGKMVNLTETQFRLYKITISCTDMRAPPFGGLWPGQEVTCECVAEMGNMELSSDRAAVAGSSYSEDGVSYFRPSLPCIVTNFQWEDSEYEEAVNWTLELEEIPAA